MSDSPSPSKPLYSPPPGLPPTYSAPPGPPPLHLQDRSGGLAPVSGVPFDLAAYAFRGWVALDLKSCRPELYAAYERLFEESQEFFAMPEADKEKFHIEKHMAASEEGYSHVEGEKDLITLRTAKWCPESIRPAATEVWEESGKWMKELMHAVAASLALPSDKFDSMVRPCTDEFPPEKRVATLMRCFRYVRPTEGDKVVSEDHRDLGLLTIVVGHSPGLEGWDPQTQQWVSIEEPLPGAQSNGLTATLMSGQTLSRLSNGLYTPGRHRVRVRADGTQYRFSLVYALRAHLPVVVSSEAFTTPITGPFLYPFGHDREVRIGDIYKAITDSHFNVNIDTKLRDQQRQKLREKAEASALAAQQAAPQASSSQDVAPPPVGDPTAVTAPKPADDTAAAAAATPVDETAVPIESLAPSKASRRFSLKAIIGKRSSPKVDSKAKRFSLGSLFARKQD